MKNCPRLALVLCCSVLPLGGCGVVARVATEAVSQKLGAGDSAPNTRYVASLKPIPNGVGLVVFEPQSTASNAQTTHLGAGCSRWLQLHVAGQGQLGKTPLWGMVEDARRRLNFADLKLDATQARQIAKNLGATHFAIGKVSADGPEPEVALSYQLFSVAQPKAQGRFQVAAPEAQIPAQLPNLARQIAAQMRLSKAQLPTSSALSASELAFLGAQKWKLGFSDVIAPSTRAALLQLAPKEALAALEAQRLLDLDEVESQTVADQLLRLAPGNALAMGEVGWLGAHHLTKHASGLAALSRKFPDNMLLCVAQSGYEKGNRARAKQVQWMERAVRVNPQSAFLWTELGEALYDEANEIRRLRYQSQMSRSEKRAIGAIYPKWQATAQKATQVDPKFAYAWARLSCAAAFNSDGSTARSAINQAIAVDPGEPAIYSWGFELYQPKWGGNAADVHQLALIAAANASKTPIDAHNIVDVFRNTKQYEKVGPILSTILQKDPKNASALTELGAITHYNHTDYAKAETLYRQALAIDPDEPLANSQLGDLMFFVHNDARGSEALYRKAIAMDDSKGYYHANLGRTLANLGRRAEAIAEAEKAKSLGYRESNHQVWSATGVSP